MNPKRLPAKKTLKRVFATNGKTNRVPLWGDTAVWYQLESFAGPMSIELIIIAA